MSLPTIEVYFFVIVQVIYIDGLQIVLNKTAKNKPAISNS